MAEKPKKPKTPLEGLLDDNARDQLGIYLDSRIGTVHAQLSNYREKRLKYEMQMADNFTWRTGGMARDTYLGGDTSEFANSIFDLQNDSLNIVGGFAAFMTARTVDDILGTEPFYSVTPEGIEDADLAAGIQRHSEWKLRMSNWKAAALDAIDLAIGLGEGVIKQAWVREVDIYEVRKTVLCIGGKPIQTIDGDIITEDDVEMDGAGGFVTAPSLNRDGAEGAPIIPIAKDPTLTVYPEMVQWEEHEVEQTNVSYDNIKAETVHYADLLIPENEACLEESNFIGQRCQRRLSDLIAAYQLDKDTISKLETETNEAKTEAAKPISHQDESAEGEITLDRPDPMIPLVECWIKWDPVGDGRLRRMYVVFYQRDRTILHMDYIANVTPDGKIPFHCVRAFTVKNRWYGRGYFEIYEKAQEFIDRQLNYVAYRNRYHANPAKFLNVDALVEDDETGDFEITPNKTYRTKNGRSAAEALTFIEFPDLDDRTWELMQMMIQVVQVRSGVTSAAQGEVSALPSTSTATGIESILQSATTLARLPMGQIKGGLEGSLLYSMKLIYANLNGDEVYTYEDGDAQRVGTLMGISVKKLEMNIRMLLTRFKARENVEAGTKAQGAIMGYLAVPEPEKGPVRPVFVQILKGLGFENADSLIRPPITAPVDPVTGQPLQIAPGAPQVLPPAQEQAAV